MLTQASLEGDAGGLRHFDALLEKMHWCQRKGEQGYTKPC